MSFNIQDSHDFYVTLLSNKVGSYERGFHNTLSNFTNIFEKPLYLKGDWCVGLKSLICHNQFKNDAGNYLRVDCSIIKTEAEEHNSIALISRPRKIYAKKAAPVLFFEPYVLEYYRVTEEVISSIKIELHTTTDLKDISYCDTILFAGQPTVLLLHFKKVGMEGIPKILRVQSSHTYNDMYKNNNAADFKCDLGPSFSFNPAEGELEAALSSISYQPEWDLFGKHHLEIRMYDKVDYEKVIFTAAIKGFKGETVDQFIVYVSDVLKEFEKGPGNPEIEVDQDDDGRLNMTSTKNCVIELPYSLMYNMGERNFVPQEGLSRHGAATGYTYQIMLQPHNMYWFQAVPEPFAFSPQAGFVLCDFIKYNIFGNQYAPLLKQIPLEASNRTNHYTTYSVKSPEFYPLSKYDLTSVEFSLRDVTGQPLPFKDKNSNVVITVLIRERGSYNPYI